MPELPEVETIACGLGRVLTGRVVNKAALKNESLYRTGSLPVENIDGSKITSVERLGKAILFRLDKPLVLVVHLGMTGNLIVSGNGRSPSGAEKHMHAVVTFVDGKELRYYDPRRFGYIFLGEETGLADKLNIGPDPFQLKPRALAAALLHRTAPIKNLLLNQRIVSGLGNIYVDEALFYARLNPLTRGARAAGRAGELLRHIRAVLKRAIRYGGTTFRDYRKHDGTAGAFKARLAVYGREGERCRVCGGKIKKIVLGGRGTHFCPGCQGRVPPAVGTTKITRR